MPINAERVVRMRRIISARVLAELPSELRTRVMRRVVSGEALKKRMGELEAGERVDKNKD